MTKEIVYFTGTNSLRFLQRYNFKCPNERALGRGQNSHPQYGSFFSQDDIEPAVAVCSICQKKIRRGAAGSRFSQKMSVEE